MHQAEPKHADEKEVWSGGYSLSTFYSGLILLGLLALVALVVLLFLPSIRGQGATWWIYGSVLLVSLIIMGVVYFYNRLNRWFVLTTERLIHREGIFVRRHHILELIRVDDVTFEQGPIESFLGCGTIFVASSDTSHPELELNGIEDVQRVAELIDLAVVMSENLVDSTSNPFESHTLPPLIWGACPGDQSRKLLRHLTENCWTSGSRQQLQAQ